MINHVLKIHVVLLVFLFCGCQGEKRPSFSGYVEGENIYLASPYFGVLDELLVARGQTVKKGQLLFKLEQNPQKISVLQASQQLKQAQDTLADMKKPKREPEIAAIKAQIAQAEARVRLAKLRVSRYQKLYDRHVSDKDTLDSMLTNLKQEEDQKSQLVANLALANLGQRDEQIKAQEAQVNASVEKLNEATWDLEQKTLSAPADGVIFDTYYRQGEFVGAQQAVLSLLTPNNIYLQFFIPLSYLSTLKVGQKITFECEGCAPNNAAEINYISPNAEYLPPLVYSRENASKLVFRVKARPQNPMNFKPGQPIEVFL